MASKSSIFQESTRVVPNPGAWNKKTNSLAAARSEQPPPERRILKTQLPRSGETWEQANPNLFPVLELPKEFYSAEAKFSSESQVIAACNMHGPLPYLLRNGRLIGFAPIAENSPLAPAIRLDATASRERVADWLATPDRAPFVIDLLDRTLRYHAWKRGMRFDETHRLFYFTRSKPKSIFWEVGGRRIQQEVTAPLTVWNQTEFGVAAEAQFGWRHRAIRAGFVQVEGRLYVNLKPAWFMTRLDGKTPLTADQVVPLESYFENGGGHEDRLRSLQFWSTVFTKGHRELRMDGGRNPIRVRMSCAAVPSHSPLAGKRANFDTMKLANIGDVRLIPELGPMEAWSGLEGKS
jgi:hypothetical protein